LVEVPRAPPQGVLEDPRREDRQLRPAETEVTDYVTQYDATDAAKLAGVVKDSAANVAVASYTYWPGGWLSCVQAFPKLAAAQRVVSIAKDLGSVARIMDFEPGNPCCTGAGTLEDAKAIVAWMVSMRVAHGVYRPGCYADRTRMPLVQQAMIELAVTRDDYVLWIALLDGSETEGEQYLAEGFDAAQITDEGAYDVSLAKPMVYPPLPPPAPAPLKPPERATGHAQAALGVNFKDGAWTIAGSHVLTNRPRWGTEPVRWMAKVGVDNRNGGWTVEDLPFETITTTG
jgi:hypothetical protein